MITVDASSEPLALQSEVTKLRTQLDAILDAVMEQHSEATERVETLDGLLEDIQAILDQR